MKLQLLGVDADKTPKQFFGLFSLEAGVQPYARSR